MNPVRKIELESGEEIFGVIRGFSLGNFIELVIALIALVIDFFFMFFLFSYGIIGRIGFVVVLALVIFLIFRYWVIRIGNCLIVTNERLIDIARRGLIGEEITILRLSDLTTVSVEIKNIGQRLFGYSDLVLSDSTGPRLAVRSVHRATRWQSKLDSWRNNTRMSEKRSDTWVYELSVPELKKLRDLIDRRIQRLEKPKTE